MPYILVVYDHCRRFVGAYCWFCILHDVSKCAIICIRSCACRFMAFRSWITISTLIERHFGRQIQSFFTSHVKDSVTSSWTRNRRGNVPNFCLSIRFHRSAHFLRGRSPIIRFLSFRMGDRCKRIVSYLSPYFSVILEAAYSLEPYFQRRRLMVDAVMLYRIEIWSLPSF